MSKRLDFPLVPFSFHLGSMGEGLCVCPPVDTTSVSVQKKMRAAAELSTSSRSHQPEAEQTSTMSCVHVCLD